MRFKRNLLSVGMGRTRTFFAVLPITVISLTSQQKETRWLEKVTVEEVYAGLGYWRVTRFLDVAR